MLRKIFRRALQPFEKYTMNENKKNPVDTTGLSKMRAEKLEARRRNILESIDRMDAAAGKKTEDLPTLHRAETKDILWMLNKHRYAGW